MSAFIPLTVAQVRAETADSVSILFDWPQADSERFAFRPGQHLTLRATIGGEEVRRNYSLCSAPHEKQLRIGIKRVAGGLFSNWVADSIHPGSVVDVLPPLGSFTVDVDPAAAHHYVGIAGGSGITPVLSLLKAVLNAEPASRFTLLYGNRDSNSVMFLEELANLKDLYLDRLQLLHFLSDEEGELEIFNGLLDGARITDALSALVPVADVSAFFICGPGPMMDGAEQALGALGVDKARIHIERFTAATPTGERRAEIVAASQKAAGTPIKVRIDGRTRTVSYDAESGNILDSARKAGLPAPYACKAGVCATCRAKVVSGKVEMNARYGLTDEEIAAGYVLTCQSIPLGEGLELDYDV